MIKNKKQYIALMKSVKILKENIFDTERLIDQSDIKQRLQLSAFKRDFVKYLKEIEDYEYLISKNLDKLEFDSFRDDMNKAIMSFRIASKVTQKQLAEEMFIQEQQIQRYEQFDYLKSSFERILQLLDVLGVQIILKKEFQNRPSISSDADLNHASEILRKRKQILLVSE
jgi:hypothetical protein